MSEQNGPPERVTGPHNGFQRGDTAPISAAGQAPGNGPGQEPGPTPTPADAAGQERTRPTFPPPNQHPAQPAAPPTPQYGAGPAPGAPVPPRPHPGTPPQSAAAQGPQPPTAAPGAQPPAGAPGAQPGTARYPGQPAQQNSEAPGGQQRREPTGSPLSAVAAQLRDGDRDASSGRISPLGWAWRGLGLVAISVVSGLLWLLIQPGDGGGQVAEDDTKKQGPPKGRYEFVVRQWEQQAQGNCGEVSTEKIADYFDKHQCQHLTRALYTTRLPDGQRVLTSVVTAKMQTKTSANQLERLTTKSGTGNIEDLVSAGRPVPDDFPDLDHDFGYASEQQGRLVVIGESAYFGDPDRDDSRLKGVTTDALRLAHAQDQRPR